MWLVTSEIQIVADWRKVNTFPVHRPPALWWQCPARSVLCRVHQSPHLGGLLCRVQGIVKACLHYQCPVLATMGIKYMEVHQAKHCRMSQILHKFIWRICTPLPVIFFHTKRFHLGCRKILYKSCTSRISIKQWGNMEKWQTIMPPTATLPHYTTIQMCGNQTAVATIREKMLMSNFFFTWQAHSAFWKCPAYSLRVDCTCSSRGSADSVTSGGSRWPREQWNDDDVQWHDTRNTLGYFTFIVVNIQHLLTLLQKSLLVWICRFACLEHFFSLSEVLHPFNPE